MSVASPPLALVGATGADALAASLRSLGADVVVFPVGGALNAEVAEANAERLIVVDLRDGGADAARRVAALGGARSGLVVLLDPGAESAALDLGPRVVRCLTGRVDAAAVLDAVMLEDAGVQPMRVPRFLGPADEVELLFQPIVAFAPGPPQAVEALARWRHPAEGTLGAARMFEAAGAAVGPSLARHLIERAMAQAVTWTGPMRALRLNVNADGADLARGDFVQDVIGALHRTRFPPERLTIELTETTLVIDLAGTAASLRALRDRGIQIALDDFGTGYSSLAYLATLPVDILKLDKLFVDRIGSGARDRIVLRGIVSMARELGLSVTAEGIEHEAQRAVLAAEGCDRWQGFLYAPPLPESELPALFG